MLARILEDMWVEPEVLEALSEEQKRILFLKMREEQVRRWRQRQESEESEGRRRPHKAPSKRVSWLLGRDGDISVSVIGEVDEFRSSKLLQNLMNNRLNSDDVNSIQREDLLPGGEAQQLGFTGHIQLPVTDVSDDHVSPNQSSEDDLEDDLKDAAEDSDGESGSSSDNLSDWTPLYRPHLSNHGNEPPLKALLSDTERDGPQDGESACCGGRKSDYGGRVAQLRQAFSSKPAHLHKGSTAGVLA